VDGARDGFWGCHGLALLRLVAKTYHVGADVDEIACRLYYPTNCGWQAWVQSLLTGIVLSHRTALVGATLVRLSGGCEAPGSNHLAWC
jgi:hypothetical protein